MKLYTKQGDGGMSSLMHGVKVSKSDERLELLGTIDELNSHIGLAKVVAEPQLKEKLSLLQQELMILMAGIAAPRDQKYKIKEEQIVRMETEIDEMEATFERVKRFVLYGGCECSARLDLARAVARRAERVFQRVYQRYGADLVAKKYLNRLSDYLYMLARFADHQNAEKAQDTGVQEPSAVEQTARSGQDRKLSGITPEQVAAAVRQVINRDFS